MSKPCPSVQTQPNKDAGPQMPIDLESVKKARVSVDVERVAGFTVPARHMRRSRAFKSVRIARTGACAVSDAIYGRNSKTISSPSDGRTATEHIENIRNILNPSIPDLANIFYVSRQDVYKWMAGDLSPEAEKLGRIVKLSQIADAFREAEILRAGSLLKMKTFDGLSLMDLFIAGRNTDDHITFLIDEAKEMEAAYQRSGLSTSQAKPTNDWQSYISIPGSFYTHPLNS